MAGAREKPPRVLFLGGNGHRGSRTRRAARALAERGIELHDARYPGFDGAPPATDFEAFLAAVAERGDALAPDLVYATGIGGLVALADRARGRLERPVVLQGAVLWGLAKRRFPRVMRVPGMKPLVRALLAAPAMQRRFERKHFASPLRADERREFFDGYARCAHFEDLFRWLTPGLLRDLEEAFARDPRRLDDVSAWWGARDTVVTTAELDLTEAALGRELPRTLVDGWAHYPYLDDPEDWAARVAAHVERLA